MGKYTDDQMYSMIHRNKGHLTQNTLSMIHHSKNVSNDDTNLVASHPNTHPDIIDWYANGETDPHDVNAALRNPSIHQDTLNKHYDDAISQYQMQKDDKVPQNTDKLFSIASNPSLSMDKQKLLTTFQDRGINAGLLNHSMDHGIHSAILSTQVRHPGNMMTIAGITPHQDHIKQIMDHLGTANSSIAGSLIKNPNITHEHIKSLIDHHDPDVARKSVNAAVDYHPDIYLDYTANHKNPRVREASARAHGHDAMIHINQRGWLRGDTIPDIEKMRGSMSKLVNDTDRDVRNAARKATPFKDHLEYDKNGEFSEDDRFAASVNQNAYNYNPK